MAPLSLAQRASRYVGLAVAVLLVLGLAAFLGSEIVQGGGGRKQQQPPPGPDAAIGQEVTEGPLTFVVTGFECRGKDLGSGPARRTALGRFCLLHLRVRNQGARPELFIASLQRLVDAEGKEYATTPVGEADELSSAVRPMNPGTEHQHTVVFDVPQHLAPTQAKLQGRPESLGTMVRLTPPGS